MAGLRWAATRRVGSVLLRSAATVGGLPRSRGADVSEPNPALHLTPPSAAVVVLTPSWRCR
ncbi:hypothetical protein R5W24_006649 [Gemmata sp. JC717]|uniref:hypothetical protein n=1 Tax=Gemmata algarum TaxID=2975278 RepID=UPI0021BB9755|nr:hypothetical protein [Gemmata algarum]MDY3557457.1 hypothetical protein [Gemmata algarum]